MTAENHSLFTSFQRMYWSLSRDMGHIWKRIYERRFPGSQSHILFALEKSGKRRMSELAELLYLTPGAVTSASDKLLDNGYIARVRDENDRRVVYLEMTEKGREELAKLQEEGKKAMKLVFNHLTDDDMERMMAIFEEANRNIEKLRREYDQ